MKIALLIGLSLIPWLVQGQLDKRFEKAYEDKSYIQLNEILDYWHSQSSKLTPSPTDKVDKEIYRIFKTFYNPFDFKIYGWTAWGDRTPMTGKPFILIQDKIPYKISKKYDSIPDRPEYADTVFSFFPKLAFKNVKVIHNSKSLNQALKGFVFNSKKWQDDEFDFSEYHDKKDFLDSLISLPPTTYWRGFVTQPDIIGVYIKDSLDEATIDYVLQSTGMRTKLRKEQGRWVIKKSVDVWISD